MSSAPSLLANCHPTFHEAEHIGTMTETSPMSLTGCTNSSPFPKRMRWSANFIAHLCACKDCKALIAYLNRHASVSAE